jgi:hypothetical protein
VNHDRRSIQLAGNVVLVLLAVGGLLRVQLCLWLGLRRIRREEDVLVREGSAARLVLLMAAQDPEQKGEGDQTEWDGDADSENRQFAVVLGLPLCGRRRRG